MKIKLLAGAALAALFAVGGVAHAEPDGWYGAVDLGYHWPDTFKVTSSTLGSQSIKLENEGWMRDISVKEPEPALVNPQLG